jgi:hypothetical protein
MIPRPRRVTPSGLDVRLGLGVLAGCAAWRLDWTEGIKNRHFADFGCKLFKIIYFIREN